MFRIIPKGGAFAKLWHLVKMEKMRKRNERKRRIINLDAAAGDNNPSSLHAAGVATRAFAHNILSVACIPISPPRRIFFVPSSVRRFQTVAVWAKNSQVVQPVVVPIPVDMVQL